MENIVIRKITCDEVKGAMDLALEVFMQFEAPDQQRKKGLRKFTAKTLVVLKSGLTRKPELIICIMQAVIRVD